MDRPQHTLTAVTLALVLTGCGGSEVEPAGSAPTDANDAAATTEPTTMPASTATLARKPRPQRISARMTSSTRKAMPRPPAWA